MESPSQSLQFSSKGNTGINTTDRLFRRITMTALQQLGKWLLRHFNSTSLKMSEHGRIHSDTEYFMAKINCIKLDTNDYPT